MIDNDDCIHDMPRGWCATCNKLEQSPSRSGEYGFFGGTTKQDLLDDICDQLRIPHEPLGVGSSIPSQVFAVAGQRTGVGRGSMPEIGQALAEKAGVKWGPDCDSRGSTSGGGSTVTREGLDAVLQALRILLP